MDTWTGKLLSKLKIKIMKKTENDFQIISMVIPSVNGNYAKLLLLEGHEYLKLREVAISNMGNNKKIFAIYSLSDLHHQIYHNEMGCLTKEQFDAIVKEIYNRKLQYGRNNKILKNVA
jgi:hypothetical protein